jgi:hypothetical protein
MLERSEASQGGENPSLIPLIPEILQSLRSFQNDIFGQLH